MGIGAYIYIERQHRGRWRPIKNADGQPSHFRPTGAGSLYNLLVTGFTDSPAVVGRRGLPSDLSGALRKQLGYDLGGPSEIEATISTWFTTHELGAYADSHDRSGDFVPFYEIIDAVSRVLGQPESLRFVAAFA